MSGIISVSDYIYFIHTFNGGTQDGKSKQP